MAITVIYALAGLALGGVVGYVLGRRCVGNRRRFWINAFALVGICVVVDFLGGLMGYEWMRIGAICAMAGAVTGIKYGGLPEVRIWETPRPAGTNAAEKPDESSSKGVGSS